MGFECRAGDWAAREAEAAQDRARAAFVTHLVGMATGVAPEAMVRGLRARGKVAEARAMAMYLLHVGFGLPQNRVAAAFGRDRSTISHACHKVEAMREGGRLDEALSRLEACVRHAPQETLA
jgi:chromosomal replication initiation ATPase DnaA